MALMMSVAMALATALAMSWAPPVWAHGKHAAVSEAVSTIVGPIPDVPMQDRRGNAIGLADAIGNGARVITFTYTRCETLCPVVVPIAADIVRALNAQGRPTRLVVLTVDPDNDGVAELAAHADALGADEHDLYLTGRPGEVRRALHYFGITSRTPEDHPPLILTRAAGGGPIIRIVVGDRTTSERIRALMLASGK